MYFQISLYNEVLAKECIREMFASVISFKDKTFNAYKFHKMSLLLYWGQEQVFGYVHLPPLAHRGLHMAAKGQFFSA